MATRLTKEEKRVMEWAGKAVRRPWFELCDLFQMIGRGEKVSFSEAQVDPFVVPFKVNALVLYHLMKVAGAKLVFGKNGNLFTIILNSTGNRIIWSCLELEEGGVYLEYYLLNDRLNQDWARKAASLLKQDRLKEAYDFLSDWIKTQDDLKHIELGVIKVANIRFFEAFMEAWEAAEEGRRLVLMGVKSIEAVRRILDEGLIRFYPEVNFSRFLGIIHPVLKTLAPANEFSQRMLSRLPL